MLDNCNKQKFYNKYSKLFEHLLFEKYETLRTNTSYLRNLTKKEHDAIQDLINDDSIVIKPAENGDNVVLWSTDEYLNEAKRRPSSQSYVEVPREHTYIAQNAVKEAVEILDIDVAKTLLRNDISAKFNDSGMNSSKSSGKIVNMKTSSTARSTVPSSDFSTVSSAGLDRMSNRDILSLMNSNKKSILTQLERLIAPLVSFLFGASETKPISTECPPKSKFE
ncbi:hypothetical protein GJ496_006735, partial [Pomphorhynchus laevis]